MQHVDSPPNCELVESPQRHFQSLPIVRHRKTSQNLFCGMSEPPTGT